MSKLPAGYIKLEYIESTGTQWIDTGYIAKGTTMMLIDCELPYNSDWAMIAGSYDSGKYFSWWTIGSAIYAYYGDGNKTGTGKNGRHTLNANENVWSDGANVFTFPQKTFTAATTILLFNVNSGGSYNKASMKLYACKIYDNGVLVRDFQPCIDATGNVGLYDFVERKLCGNAGTGTFTAGPETPAEPDAPKTIRVEELSNDRIRITWDAVIDATGYRLYSNNVLLTDTTLTSYVVNTKMFSSYVFSVLAYNNVGDSNSTTTVYSTIPEDPYNYLVYDRTQADADALKQLIQRGYQSLTPMQLEEWNSIASKGAWNYTDANRVGATINYMRTLLAASGLDVSDIPVASVASNINTDIRNENVTQLQESIKQLQQLYETNPDIVIMTPGPNWKYTQANQLEENLHILYEETKSYYIWPNAYDATCGGEYL